MVSLIPSEKRTWSEDHNVKFDEGVRANGQITLNRLPNGTKLYKSYMENATMSGLSGIGRYQHWFIVAIEQTINNSNSPVEIMHFIEFGAATLNYNDARVNFNTNTRGIWRETLEPTALEALLSSGEAEEFELNNAVRQRIQHVLGMKNYSMCLRNCEHVANYIFNGLWRSNQLEGSNLMDIFLSTVMGDRRKLINTFPSKIKPKIILGNEPVEQTYSFISNEIDPKNKIKLFRPKSMQYFLDNDEQDSTYNILLIGPSGAGKSNFVNVLLNRNIVESEASFEGVTNEIVMIKCDGKVYDNNQNQYVDKEIIITDTIGLSDRRWDKENMPNLFEFLRDHISSSFRHFDLVYIVFSADRLIKESVDNIKAVFKWLNYSEHINRIRFIVTKSDNLSDDDKIRMRKEAIKILGIEKNVSNLEPREDYLVYFTGFPPERNGNEDNLVDSTRSRIGNELRFLYSNIAHTNNSSRVEVNLNIDVRQNQNSGRRCSIL